MTNREKFTELLIQWRGMVIEDHIKIEKSIQSYIVLYFCDTIKKRDEFIEYALFHLSFDNSKEIFTKLLEKNEKDVYKKYKKELNFIDDINRERNIIAHYMAKTTDNDVEEFFKNPVMRFVKFRNGTKYEIFDQKRIKDFSDKLKAIEKMFDEIHPLYKK